MEIQPKADFYMVETENGLRDAAGRLLGQKQVAVDLEADSMFHFREKVCLLQVAHEAPVYVIDPLEVEDLAPIRPLFSDPGIENVFHGADYDIRSLYRDFAIEVNNLFDTELACRFLGLPQTGLDTVLELYFQVTLDKRYQKKNWSQRPLPREMVEYAAQDVLYLIPLAEMLKKELQAKGRLEWVHEECEVLSRVRPASTDEAPLYTRFKGAGRLPPRTLAVLEALLSLRQEFARRKDLPLFKVMGNQPILKLALSAPTGLRKLAGTGALSRKQINMYGAAVVERIQGALAIPANQLPRYPYKPTPARSPAVTRRSRALKRWRDAKAEEMGMDPGLVLNKTLLGAVAAANPRTLEGEGGLAAIPEIRNWRVRAFGEEMLAVLARTAKKGS